MGNARVPVQSAMGPVRQPKGERHSECKPKKNVSGVIASKMRKSTPGWGKEKTTG